VGGRSIVSAVALSSRVPAVPTDLLASTLSSLQRVLHMAARVALNLTPHDHVTPAVRELHRLLQTGSPDITQTRELHGDGNGGTTAVMGLEFMTVTAVIVGMGTAFTLIPRGWGQHSR